MNRLTTLADRNSKLETTARHSGRCDLQRSNAGHWRPRGSWCGRYNGCRSRGGVRDKLELWGVLLGQHRLIWRNRRWRTTTDSRAWRSSCYKLRRFFGRLRRRCDVEGHFSTLRRGVNSGSRTGTDANPWGHLDNLRRWRWCWGTGWW